MSFAHTFLPVINIIITIISIVTIALFTTLIPKIENIFGKSASKAFKLMLIGYLISFLSSLLFYLLFFELPPLSKGKVLLLRILIQICIIFGLFVNGIVAMLFFKVFYDQCIEKHLFYALVIVAIVNHLVSLIDFVSLYYGYTMLSEIFGVGRIICNLLLIVLSTKILIAAFDPFKQLNLHKALLFYVISIGLIYLSGTLVYFFLSPIYKLEVSNLGAISEMRAIISIVVALFVAMSYSFALISVILFLLSLKKSQKRESTHNSIS